MRLKCPVRRPVRTLLSLLLVFALLLMRLEPYMDPHLRVYRLAADRGGFIADLQARPGLVDVASTLVLCSPHDLSPFPKRCGDIRLTLATGRRF